MQTVQLRLSGKFQSVLCTAVLVTLLFPFPHTLPNAYGATALEEVIVTARKREESVQEIPLSVTAFSKDEIERGGFLDLEDISLHTPGLQFNSELSGTRPGRLFTNIRFRGIDGGEFSALSTASLFVDGIYVIQGATSLPLLDLERVEVIKGPQSAIFGRNSFAGAINYVTTTPSLNESSGKLQIEAATYEQYEVAASFEVPIIQDKLAIRIGARFYNKGEMYTATDGGALGEQSSESIYATLYAQPTENLSLKFRAFYQEDEDGPNADAWLSGRGEADTCTGTTRPGFDVDGNPVTLTPSEFICGRIPELGDPTAPRIDSNTGMFPQFPSFSGANADFLVRTLQPEGDGITGVPDINSFGIHRKIIRVSLVGDYTFDNGITVTATGAYNDNKASHFRDWDRSAIESWWVSSPQKGKDKSFDLRVASSQDGRLRWSGGFNIYDQEFLTSSMDGILVHVCGNFAGLFDPTGASGGFCDVPFSGTSGLDGGDFVDVWSVYGAVGFDITDQWTIDLEGRYQEDERNDGVADFKKTFKDFIPRVTLTYKPTDDVTIYGIATQGVLPGVVNSPLVNCSDVTFTTPFRDPFTGLPSTSSQCEQFREQLGDDALPVTDTQKLDTLEFGLKTLWADGRLLVNVAAYYHEWKNAPAFLSATSFGDADGDGTPDLNPFIITVAVAGLAEYYGVELETQYLLNENWSMGFNLSYNENEFKELTIPPGGRSNVLGTTNVKGHRASRFPKWSGNLSTTYTRPSTGVWNMYTRWDINYNGKAPAGLTNLSELQDYYLVNARLGIEKENFRIEVFVKNLFDEDSWRTAQEFVDFTRQPPSVFDFSGLGIILIPQDKRTIGIRSSFSF